MPINQTIWEIDDSKNSKEVKFVSLNKEEYLEDVLQQEISILNPGWLVIGRQVLTGFNKFIDLLAIDANGSIIIIELKKGKTPRDVVAQSIDYASWVQDLKLEKIIDIYEQFNGKYLKTKESFERAFLKKFNLKLDGEIINSSHQMVVVAADSDSSTERIITYLNDFNVPVNIIFFKIFEAGGKKLISRAWFIDPGETEENAVSRGRNPFNGEYYASFGDGKERSWDDAVKYGFISGGGGDASNPTWYSQTLNMLSIGSRVWVNIPGIGYVGVGEVAEVSKKAKDVSLDDGKNIYQLTDKANYQKEYIEDDDRAEYMVKIKWLKAVSKDRAVKEVGFFGNQNTVCAPTTDKWPHTVDRLKDVWSVK